MSYVDDFFNDRQAARETVVGLEDNNPDEAARAIELSRVTGVPSLAVVNDIPGFEKQARDTLATDIINDNPALQEYINSNPMAARISSDDWGNLDGIVKRVANVSAAVNSTLIKTAHEYLEGVRSQGHIGSWLYNTPEKQEYLEKMHPVQAQYFLLGWTAVGLPIEAISRVFGPIPGAAKTFVEEGVGQATGDRDLGRRLGRETAGFLEYVFNKPPGFSSGPGPTSAILANRELRSLADATGPYLRAGVEPPVGLHPALDDLKKEQAKRDGKELQDLTTEVQQSSTRARSPEMFADLLRQQTQANIYLPFEAVVRLYGEKPIKPDDGVLGWVPNIQEQVRTMSMTGGDIVIPLADWLAKSDKAVAKDLHDNIRVRRGGFTLEEAKEYGKEKVAPDPALENAEQFQGIVKDISDNWGEQQIQQKAQLFPDEVALLKKAGFDIPEDGIISFSMWTKLKAEAERVRKGIPKADNVRKEMADIEVFHGSPHSFEAFSMEAIGTGEGAQSYGHGLYFAQNRAVAESYANMRKQTGTATAVNAPGPFDGTPVLDNVKSPNLYRARIKANPEEFLDWDKALKDQAPGIKQAIENIARERNLEVDWEMTGEAAYKSAVWNFAPETGQGNVRVPGAPQASKFFNQAGIPGIRYLDQGSRIDKPAIEKQIRDLEAQLAMSTDPKTTAMIERQIAARKQDLETPSTYNYVLFDDALVEILDRNGEAIQAVRQQAGLEPLAMAEEARTRGKRVPLEGEETRHYGRHTTAYVLPYEKWHSIEKIIDNEVDKLLKRVAPTVEHQGAQDLTMTGHGGVSGAYLAYNDRAPIILWSLGAKDPFAVARHEAIHFLRDNDFFTAAEWDILRNAAESEGWLAKHKVEQTYTEATTGRSGTRLKEIQLEEAIAEEYATWAKNPENVKGALRQVFEKLHMLLVEIKEAIAKALGYEPKPEELFQMVESGEIGSRYGQPEIDRSGVAEASVKRPEQLELDVTRQQDKAIFDKASAIGMTVDQYKRYLKLIEKRNLEDIQAQRDRAIALEKKRQSLEWRQEAEGMEDEVRTNLRNRPDIAATEFFRYGELYGEKVDGPRPKIDEALLTDQERAMLPAQWVGPRGLHPDDAAALFGYTSRGEFLERVSAFEAGRGNVRPGEYLNRLVKAEVERRMIERHGELDANILAAAEDHVLGVTQMDLLHEETLARASQAGQSFSFTKEDVQGWAAKAFNESNAGKVSAVRFLDDAGRAGRLAELALLKGDFAEAFRHKQAQYLSALMAKEAKAFEKETQRFERLADRFSRREGPKAVDQEFTDQIQALLLRAELPVRRTGAELQEAFDRAGYRNLDEFVKAQQADGWQELAVHPSVINDLKPAEKMSVEEARFFRTAITSLNHVGREVQKIEVAGVKEEFDAFRERVVNQIKTLPRIPRKQNPIAKWLFGWDSELTKMEEIIKDLDLRQEAGPLWDVLIRPMAEAKHTEYAMMEELSRRFRDMQVGSKDWQKTLNDTIPQTFFFDPDGLLFDLSRSDMIGVMLNFGNKSNIEKFVKAWKGEEQAAVFEHKLRTMIEQNATKADWDFVQSMWDVFEMWRPQANEMYYQLSGVPPKWIDAQPFANAHGNYRGGYFPIIFDREWSKIAAKDAESINPDSVFGNYHRSTPVNHYTTERTGYIDYIDFQDAVDTVPMRMQQEIHDIAYRRQIIAAKKVIADPSIRAAIRHHYGPQYEAQLKPWLQKIASQYNDNPELRHFTSAVRRARYNLVAHALGANLRVILSPDVGTANLKVLWDTYKDPSVNWKFANENSKEIPHTFHNMDRDFRERLEQTIKAKGWDKFQADAARWAFAPAVYFSQVFRVATWTAEYKANMAKGLSEGEAVSLADSVVRERHGAAGIADLPAIMTQGEGWKMWTMFYGFFNTMYNWQRQIPGAYRRGDRAGLAKALWGAVLVPAAFGALLFNQQKENDSWGKTIAKALIFQPLSTIPFARDAAQLFAEGYSSRSPVASVLQAAYSLGMDIKKYKENKKVDKPITHAANVVGLSTGLPLAQIGRTTQFGVDVYTGKQRPRNVPEWIRGIISGEARLKK